MTFQEWFDDFIRDKVKLEVIVTDNHALRDFQRYRDRQGRYWEFGFTFTHRLVLRHGYYVPEKENWEWSEWETRHDVTDIS